MWLLISFLTEEPLFIKGMAIMKQNNWYLLL